MAKQKRVIIVGGGITGLVAAYTLRQKASPGAQHDLAITILEGRSRLGGNILTEQFAGTVVDTGAEALVLQDEGRQLLQELDLTSELLPQASRGTTIWARGQLRPLPDGLVMGVPTDLFSLLRSGLLSPQGMMRAGMDLVLPRTRLSADPTVQEAIGSRLGREVVARLIEPLLGGIHAGKADSLSLGAVAPHLLAAARAHRSLLLGLCPPFRTLRRSKQAPRSSLPQLSSFTDGLERLITRLRDHLEHTGVEIQLSNRLQTIKRSETGTYRLICADGEHEAEQVVLAVPAWEASRLLCELDSTVAQELGAIAHASVIVAHLGYRRSALASAQLQGSGFLVPRAEGRLMNACTWVTKKWARTSASNLQILRCSSGRMGDERASRMSDQAFVEALHNELVEAIGVTEPPVEARVTRWERAFPQYQSGHQARIQQVEARLAEHFPSLHLAGAAYHGVGLASCLKDGARVAQQMLTQMDQLPERNTGVPSSA